ncbi:AoPex11B [Colletotrichum simmondsii]|uniref:AoPex11B n=1 Tax=Colletotrichum simmondsii TaxID=703756 RepID=A0A135SY77_9PEZI|nr:AoPex11B [Colletotrichum simmondsii]
MTSLTFDQFVAFGSDSAGLERILRGLQALTAIFSAYPSLVALALLDADPPFLEALGPLRGHLNLTRRFIRFFWFLNSFGTSYNLFTSISSSPSPYSPSNKSQGASLETWLDIIKFTLLGLYGGLESLTLPDLLGVPQIAYFGAERTRALNVEAQRFWLLALAAGVFANLTRVLKAFAYAPVPQHGHGYGTGEKPGEEKKQAAVVEGGAEKEAAAVSDEKKGDEGGEDEKLDWEAERTRLRAIVMKRREDRKQWRREVAVKVKSLGRKIFSDSLDCLIPGVILGWVNVQPGTVGIAMFITTVLSSRDIWDRCGATVSQRRGS